MTDEGDGPDDEVDAPDAGEPAADSTDAEAADAASDPDGTDGATDAPGGAEDAGVPTDSTAFDGEPGPMSPASGGAEDGTSASPRADVAADRPADPGSAESSSVSEDEELPDAPAYGPGVPEDVRTYDRFSKIDGGTYERANDFLRDRTYITAREWAIARLCADFRTETGVEMTKIGEHLPELVPFMTDTYSPQAVNQARAAFEEKVRKAGATFLYGAMSDFFTAEELDDVMYEATEVAKFLLEVEGVDLTVEEELEAEDAISEVMREVREHSAALRHDEVVCPDCGHHIEAEDD